MYTNSVLTQRDQYTFDASGNRSSMTSEIYGSNPLTVSTSYTYNALNQLTQETKNMGAGQLTTNYAYDANGNLTAKSGGTTASYSCDAYNRTTEIQLASSSLTFAYNALGQRKSKTQTISGVQTTTLHAYDDAELIADKTGNAVNRYFFTYGFTGQMTDTDTIAAITDYAGDVVNFWNVTARALTGEVGTDAYGNQVMSGTVNSPYKYKSYYFDGESGLYYLNARYYDPAAGRFTQEDPARDGMNWYSYCGGDPVNFVDPTGEFAISTGLALFGLGCLIVGALTGCNKKPTPTTSKTTPSTSNSTSKTTMPSTTKSTMTTTTTTTPSKPPINTTNKSSSIKTYSLKKDGNKKLSAHFTVKEFAAPGKNEVKIDDKLIDILEKIFSKLKLTSMTITSGYRLTDNGYHRKGQAADISCYRNGVRLQGPEILCAAEDVGATGIGWIPGNNTSRAAVHIDTRPTKYWFDEAHGNKSIGNIQSGCQSWYKYDMGKYFNNLKPKK